MQAYQHDEEYAASMTHYLAGNWREAQSAFAALDAKRGDDAFIKLLRGNIAYSLGHLDESAAHYRAAIKIKSDFGQAYYKLGVCLYRTGRLQEALQAFETVVDLKSQSHAMAAYFVGLIRFFLGQDDHAATAFGVLKADSPDSKIANLYLAQIHIKRKEFDSALPLLEDLASVTPDFAEVHYMLGTVHFGLHNNDAAIRCFRRALELNPEDERSKTKVTLLTDVQWP